MRWLLAATCLLASIVCYPQSIPTKFEQTQGRETPAYHEIIQWWQQLDQQSAIVKMLTMGPSDAGYPLHLVIVANDRDFDLASQRKKNKRILLIINGIHPGEPDGIDASMLLVRDIVINKKKLPDNIVLAIIPVYNIGGCLNRSENYRVDQNGPAAFGFRGNSQNLDLNRDFIKCDSREARSFAQIFHLCDPDVLIDNHVSNGADYQHVMTLLTSQHSKLGGVMGEYLHKEFEPAIYALMKEKGYDLVPYVNFSGNTPDNGLIAYFDGPRYSSGYASLWHSFAFVPETHMLKPYDQRVASTYALMECFIDFTSRNSSTIKKLRDQTKAAVLTQSSFPVSWTLNRNRHDEILYKGYEAGYKPSEVSGLPRLYYDRSKPYEKKVKYYNYFDNHVVIQKPKAKDTTILVEVYRIEDYRSSPRPYEMHHPNSNVSVSTRTENITFRKGDMLVPLDQVANRFLVEVLEPQGMDSYFSWNFFDGILAQKEGYSSYAFEDIAAQFLKDHPDIRAKLEQRKATDTAFANSAAAQLDFVYKNSPFYEPAHMRYPVYRVVN